MSHNVDVGIVILGLSFICLFFCPTKIVWTHKNRISIQNAVNTVVLVIAEGLLHAFTIGLRLHHHRFSHTIIVNRDEAREAYSKLFVAFLRVILFASI